MLPSFARASGGGGGHGHVWLSQVPGLEHFPIHVVTAVFVSILLIASTWLARVQLMRVMRNGEAGLIPEEKLTFRNFFEIVAEGLFNLCKQVLGEKDAPKFFPVIGTLFLYIFSCNLIGMIPGFLPPTDNLNLTLALGTFAFLYYNWVGLKEHGIGYLKHFMGPILWLAPLMFVIEIAGHAFRPLSLALRLRGNIMGDHVVLSIFSDLVPWLLPVIFYGLGLFVCFIQAFVFSLLTMVYISLSTSHDH